MTFYELSDINITTHPPDTLPDQLQMGDKLCRSHYIALQHPFSVHTTTTLITFVASIQPFQKFKVYMGFGERHDNCWVAKNGIKVKSEDFARALFPELAEYKFKYQ